MKESNIEKKFFTDLISETYKTRDFEHISDKLKKDLDVSLDIEEIEYLLSEDYELESRKMEYSLSLKDIFYE